MENSLARLEAEFRKKSGATRNQDEGDSTEKGQG